MSVNKWKVFGIGVFCALCFLLANNIHQEMVAEKHIQWQVFSPPDGGFTILMPGQPNREEIKKPKRYLFRR